MATRVRQEIYLKAHIHEVRDNEEPEEQRDARGRVKYPRSMPSRNPEGLSEVQLRRLGQSERGLTRKYKKRHKKELPSAIRTEIVRLYTEEHMHQHEIAKLFKISGPLVGRLVKEAKQFPEKQ